MAEVKASNHRSKGRVVGDGTEKLAEDSGVGDGDVAVKGIKSSSMNGSGGEEKGHEVCIACGEPVRRKLDD